MRKKKPKKRSGESYHVNGGYQIADTTNGASLGAKQNGGLCAAEAKMSKVILGHRIGVLICAKGVGISVFKIGRIRPISNTVADFQKIWKSRSLGKILGGGAVRGPPSGPKDSSFQQN